MTKEEYFVHNTHYSVTQEKFVLVSYRRPKEGGLGFSIWVDNFLTRRLMRESFLKMRRRPAK